MLRQSDKKSPEKSGFDFLGDFVLTEELGAAAGQGVKCLPLQVTGVFMLASIIHVLKNSAYMIKGKNRKMRNTLNKSDYSGECDATFEVHPPIKVVALEGVTPLLRFYHR
ncbi:hypothetical protein [Metabacillus indicus]|uniref:hypothetical protein n=1 Tax=Metabacillus indicus TaxID=246786 RepID=UPI002A0A690B|nr:hypothetical protein [Metabacillus indicus]